MADLRRGSVQARGEYVLDTGPAYSFFLVSGSGHGTKSYRAVQCRYGMQNGGVGLVALVSSPETVSEG